MHHALREIRAVFRLLQVALLIAGGLLTVRLLFPLLGTKPRQRIKQAWAARVVAALGVRIELDGEPLAAGLAVCNHISWLDVFVIDAVSPTTFVCKDDVRAWPVIGWLVEHTGTLFIARGSRAAAARSAQAMSARLTRGERVAIFPEGTTTSGEHLLPFRAALFEAAPESGARVQPLALRYVDAGGQHTRAAAYDGDLSFGQSLLRIARSSGLRAQLTHLDALPGGLDRRELCRQAESRIAATLNLEAAPHAQAA